MNELKIISRKGEGERDGQIDRERKKERERLGFGLQPIWRNALP